MNTMEALGAGPNVSPKGETPGLNLGADAETLALFASLFAMMQAPQKDGVTAGPVAQATPQKDGVTAGPVAQATPHKDGVTAGLVAQATPHKDGVTAGLVAQATPQSSEAKPLLPAAAMLMAELVPAAPVGDTQVPLANMLANDPKTGEGEPGDTAGLLKLMLAAHDITAPDHQPMMPVDTTDDNITAAAPTRTATEMLTGAIEILKSLELDAKPSGPIEETPDQIATPPAPAMVLQADPAFIGPMPVVAVPPTQSAPTVVMLADPDFVGLMEEAPSSSALRMPAMVLQADRDFIGPMPAVTPSVTLVEQAVLLPADPDFIGPMPVMTPIGPAATVAVKAAAAPSPDFIGPMPVTTSASTVQTADASNAALDGVGPAPAATLTAAKALAETRLEAPATKTAEPVPHMTTISAASPTQINASPETSRLSTSATGPSTVPNSGASSALAHGPTHGPTHGALYGPNPDLYAEPEQLVKSGLPKRSASEIGADKDDGFVLRRADMVTAGKDMGEKTASQQKAAEIQIKGASMMSKAADLLQGSAASSSASVQALAQQTAVTSQAGNTISSATVSDVAQNVAAGTAGGQSGGQSGSQHSAQQMADGGMARGTADRTLLHRLNTDNAGWSETMVKRLTTDLRSGVQNVRIILEPRQLGRLNVELGLRNGQASIRIAAETQEAARLLAGARGQLGQMLESAGLRLAGFQATGLQAGDTGLDTGQGSQGRGGEGASDNAGRNNAGRDQDFSNKMATVLDEHADDVADSDAALRKGETAVLSILA